MSDESLEQLLLDAVGLLDRISEKLGTRVRVGSRTHGEYTNENYVYVQIGNLSASNPDPVVALYEAMGKVAEWNKAA